MVGQRLCPDPLDAFVGNNGLKGKNNREDLFLCVCTEGKQARALGKKEKKCELVFLHTHMFRVGYSPPSIRLLSEGGGGLLLQHAPSVTAQ